MMKKIFLMLAAVLMSAAAVSAQDLAQATETYNNGAMELQMGNNAMALEHFQSALKMGEGLGDDALDLVNNCKKGICSAYMGMAKALYNSKDFDGAINAFKQTEEVAKGYGETDLAAEAAELISQTMTQKWNADGKAAMRAKNYAGAIENFKKIMEQEPNNANVAIQLGQALMRTGDLDGSISALTVAKDNGQAENADKLISQIYLMKAQTALKAKKYQEVLDMSAKSNEFLENANAYKLAASAAQKLGKNSECISLYEKYLAVSPAAKDANGVICTIAILFQQAGNKEKAKEYYQKIVNDPQYGTTAKQQLEALQ